jgi:hypothetical protein
VWDGEDRAAPQIGVMHDQLEDLLYELEADPNYSYSVV